MDEIMPVTTSLVSEHFIPPLAGIIMEYAVSKDRHNFTDFGIIGEYETCMRATTYSDHCDTFLGGCFGGHIAIVELGLRHVELKCFDNGCNLACLNGHLEIVKLLISLGANNYPSHISHAARNNHVEIVEYLFSSCGFDDWDYGLRQFSSSGSQELIDLMVSHGATNFNVGLYQACRFGHLEIAKFMISKGANYWNECLRIACYLKHHEIVRLLIASGATECAACLQPIETHM